MPSAALMAPNSSIIARNPYADLMDAALLRDLGRPVAAGVPIESVEHLGSLVRRHRSALGLTQAQLANRAGVGRRFVSELESGKQTIRAAEMLDVCGAIGLTLSARLERDAPRDRKTTENITRSDKDSDRLPST